MSALLKYPGQPLAGTDCGSPCAELLRLDLSVAPTAPEDQKRLGPLATIRRGSPRPTPLAGRMAGGPTMTSLTLPSESSPVCSAARHVARVPHTTDSATASTSSTTPPERT